MSKCPNEENQSINAYSIHVHVYASWMYSLLPEARKYLYGCFNTIIGASVSEPHTNVQHWRFFSVRVSNKYTLV